MGGSVWGYHNRENFPQTCYNAANHWQLGWYSEFQRTMDENEGPTLIKISAFVDHDLAVPGKDIIVLKVGNFYMQYNRAKGINQDTFEYKDTLVITQESKSGGATSFVAALDENETLRAEIGSKPWTAQVCSKHQGNQNSKVPDYLMVSVGFGKSICGSASDKQAPVPQTPPKRQPQQPRLPQPRQPPPRWPQPRQPQRRPPAQRPTNNNKECAQISKPCQVNSDCCSGACATHSKVCGIAWN